jgi:hypothetical protein
MQLQALYPNVYKNVNEYGSRYCQGVSTSLTNLLPDFMPPVMIDLLWFFLRVSLGCIKVLAITRSYITWWKPLSWSAGWRKTFFQSCLLNVDNRLNCLSWHLNSFMYRIWTLLTVPQIFWPLGTSMTFWLSPCPILSGPCVDYCFVAQNQSFLYLCILYIIRENSMS